MKASLDELRELVLIAVEDIDVHFACDAINTTVGT
jgi:hypothetical protein